MTLDEAIKFLDNLPGGSCLNRDNAILAIARAVKAMQPYMCHHEWQVNEPMCMLCGIHKRDASI